jgi:hypothetical protein
MNKGDWLTWLRKDQRARWTKGERVGVEAYAKRHQSLRDDRDALLDLIYNEVVLREEAGEAPRLEEYLRRFAPLEADLRLLFEVHHAIEAGALEENPPRVLPENATPAPLPKRSVPPPIDPTPVPLVGFRPRPLKWVFRG